MNDSTITDQSGTANSPLAPPNEDTAQVPADSAPRPKGDQTQVPPGSQQQVQTVPLPPELPPGNWRDDDLQKTVWVLVKRGWYLVVGLASTLATIVFIILIPLIFLAFDKGKSDHSQPTGNATLWIELGKMSEKTTGIQRAVEGNFNGGKAVPEALDIKQFERLSDSVEKLLLTHKELVDTVRTLNTRVDGLDKRLLVLEKGGGGASKPSP